MSFRTTIVCVTHSIDEALYLADRVVVMTFRPGTLKEQLQVMLDQPRDPNAPAFNALKHALTELVMHEQARHERAEHAQLPTPTTR